MKVKELRDALKNYNEKEKENIIVNLYNVIPKNVKDSKEVDRYLMSANEKMEKIKPNSEFNEDLIDEINMFMECAEEGLYSRPNKTISKKERSNWRFKVIRFYKALSNVPTDNKDGEVATEYLRRLFRLLCNGCNTLIFSNWEPFRAIGISRYEYLDCLFKRILTLGYSDENLIKCIKICMYPIDCESLKSDALEQLFDTISDKDTKLRLIELTQKEIEEYSILIKKKYNESYELQEYGSSVSYMYLTMHMTNEAISYLSKFEKNEEILFYVIFDKLCKLDYYEEWIEVYEKNMYKVKYRDSIKECYKKIKEMI